MLQKSGERDGGNFNHKINFLYKNYFDNYLEFSLSSTGLICTRRSQNRKNVSFQIFMSPIFRKILLLYFMLFKYLSFYATVRLK